MGDTYFRLVEGIKKDHLNYSQVEVGLADVGYERVYYSYRVRSPGKRYWVLRQIGYGTDPDP